MDFSDESMDCISPEDNCSETSLDSESNENRTAYAWLNGDVSPHSFEDDNEHDGFFSPRDESHTGREMSDDTHSGSDRDNNNDDISYDHDSSVERSRDSEDNVHLNSSQGLLQRGDSSFEGDSNLESFPRPGNLMQDVPGPSRLGDSASFREPLEPANLAETPDDDDGAAVGGNLEEHQENDDDELPSSDELEEGGSHFHQRGGRVSDIIRVLRNSQLSYSQSLANSALEDMGSCARTSIRNWDGEYGLLGRSLERFRPSLHLGSRSPRHLSNSDDHSSQSSWNHLSSGDSAEDVGEFPQNSSGSSQSNGESMPHGYSTTLDVNAEALETRANSSSGSDHSVHATPSLPRGDNNNNNNNSGDNSPGGVEQGGPNKLDSSNQNGSEMKSPNGTPVVSASPKGPPGSPASEEMCCICLGSVSNACVAGSCLHRFCFPCLKEWSERKNECPLCKNKFEVIIHDIKGERDYKEYKVKVRPPDLTSLMELSFSIMLGPGRSFIVPSEYRRPPRTRIPFNALNFRMRIYNNDLWVRFITANNRVRICSPALFREQPALAHRLLPFIHRDLRALSVPLSLESTIMNFLEQYRILSRSMVRALLPHLRHKTRHFLHELNCFAHSSYDLVGYDSAVRTRYSDYSLREGPPNLDIDEEVDEELRQPQSVEIDLTDDSPVDPPTSITNQATSLTLPSGPGATHHLSVTIPSNTGSALSTRTVPSSSSNQPGVPSPVRLRPHARRDDASLSLSRNNVSKTPVFGMLTSRMNHRRYSADIRAAMDRFRAVVSDNYLPPLYKWNRRQADASESAPSPLQNRASEASASTTLVVSSSDEEGVAAPDSFPVTLGDHNYTSNPIPFPCTCQLRKSTSQRPSKSCVCKIPKPPAAAETSDSDECLIIEEKKTVCSQKVQSESQSSNTIESIVLSDSAEDESQEARISYPSGSKRALLGAVASEAKSKVADETSSKRVKPVRLDRKSFSISRFLKVPSSEGRVKSNKVPQVEESKIRPEASSSSKVKSLVTSENNESPDESPVKREPKDDPSRIKRSHVSKTKSLAGSTTASSSRSVEYESASDSQSKPSAPSLSSSYEIGRSIPHSSPVTARVEFVRDRVSVTNSCESASARKSTKPDKRMLYDPPEYVYAYSKNKSETSRNKRNYHSSEDDEERRSPIKMRFKELCFSSDSVTESKSPQEPQRKKKYKSKHQDFKSAASGSFLNIARAARPVISDSDSDELSSHHHQVAADHRWDRSQVSSASLKTSRHSEQYEPNSDSTSDSSLSDSSRRKSRSIKKRRVDTSTSSSDRRVRKLLLERERDSESHVEMSRQSRSEERKQSKSKKKKRDKKKSKSRDRISRHKHKKSSKSSHKRRRRDSSDY